MKTNNKYEILLKETHQFYDIFVNLKKHLDMIDNLMKDKTNIVSEPIINEITLRENKLKMDLLKSAFKPAELIIDKIKHQLNDWKKYFVGEEGLEKKIEINKKTILQPYIDEQVKYHNYIESINLPLYEKSKIKTTLGLKEYKKYRILNIDADVLPKEFWEINMTAIKLAIKQDKQIPGVTYEIIKELK